MSMTLSAGSRFGAYEVVGLLGVGGMGEVYRATDSRLHRDVALKVLPDLFASDPERLARFQREAQVLASLNHPHIAAIHGLERSGSIQALVLELVDGPTLAERIAEGPIPVDEALPIACQVAEALEAAHELGVIHRDLKPANIKLRSDGTAKVLDFGLAKAVERADAANSSAAMLNSPTITSPAMMTAAGIILGTAAYMSPEQVKWKPADRRSDVWAFGCVLYEMLTGRRAFPGDDVADTLASVLRAEPNWDALPPDLPDPIRRLLRRSLEKDRRRRLPDVGVARLEIEDALAPPAVRRDGQTIPPAAPERRPLWRRAWPFALTALVTGVLAAIAALALKRDPPQNVLRSRFELAEYQQISPARRGVAISPDGTRIVFAANRRLYLRKLSELDAVAIPGTDVFQVTPSNPTFSPDGDSVAFVSSATTGSGTLHKIAANGGTAVTLCPVRFPNSGMSWGDSGIVFGQGGEGLMRVSSGGGQPERLISVGKGEEAAFPVMLPGERAVLFTLATSAAADRWDNARIVVQTIGSPGRKVLVEGGSDATYVSSGHLVFAQAGTLFAVPFDLNRLEVTGGKVPVVPGVRRGTQGAAHYSVSRSGTLLYLLGPAFGLSAVVPRQFVVMDRKGVSEPLKIASANYVAPRLSPDGTQLAFGTEDPNEAIISVYDLSGGPGRRLTYGGKNRYPVWSADGQRIAFQSDREGDLAIFWQRADGTDTATRLTKPESGVAHLPESWSRDGARLSFSAIAPAGVSLWTLSVADKTASRFSDVRSTSPFNSEFSPDGKWMAYTLRSSSDASVFVEPFPATGAKYQIASDVSHHPLWSRDGKELSYRLFGEQQMIVSVRTEPSFTFSNPVRLPGDYATIPYGTPRNIDVMPDGRFLIAAPATPSEVRAAAPREIHIVVNWAEELRQRVPSGS